MKKKAVSGIMLILLLTSMLTLAFNIQPVKAELATIIVPDDYPTIQAAVNAASPGDTIIVRDGTYIENVDVTKSLTIRSENGAEVTIVQAANEDDHVLEVTADYVNINGFTVQGAGDVILYDGGEDGWEIEYDFAGIFIAASHCNISNNTVTGNVRGISGSSNNILTNNTVYANFLVGIYVSSNNILTNNTVSGSVWVGIAGGNNNILTNNTVHSNQPLGMMGDGIGIYVWRDNTLTDNIIYGNVWAGVSLLGDSNTLTDNTIYSNAYTGIWLYYSNDNILSNNTINDNQLGIEIDGGSHNSIYLNNFISNGRNVWLEYYPTNIWNSPEEITYTYNGKTFTNYLGNYWSDYTGVDEKSGPNQDQPGSDGIGDIPYIIDEYNRDRYPLMKPWPPTPPAAVKILPVPYYSQGDTDWCIPTSMSMIFKYYGQNIHSWDIAKDWGWGRAVPWWELEGLPWTVSSYFNARGLTTETFYVLPFHPIDFDTIKAWIDRDMPVLLSMPLSIKHAVVIFGYDTSGGSEKVYINDPSSTLTNKIVSIEYPYIAALDWNDVAEYVDWISWAMAVGGERPERPLKGTIDILGTYGPPSYYPISFIHASRLAVYSWYDRNEGLIWERSKEHALVLDPSDEFVVQLNFVNHMEYDETYVFEVEFAKYIEDLGIFWPAVVKIWLTDPVMGRHSLRFWDRILLRDLLLEYGEYMITLRLWDETFTEKYDEVVFPSIEYSPGLMFQLDSPADLYVTDPQGLHVGVDPSTGQVVNEIPGAVYTGPGSEPQLIAIPNPLDGNYAVLLIGTATGIYSVTMELVTLQETITQTYTGEIVQDAVYVYDIGISDQVMTANPDPIAELEYLKEFIMNLPDEVFDKSIGRASQLKKALSNKIDEVIEKVEVSDYTDAINKLLNDVRAKMDGNSTAKDWIIDPTTQFKLCITIDHIISNIEILRQEG